MTDAELSIWLTLGLIFITAILAGYLAGRR